MASHIVAMFRPCRNNKIKHIFQKGKKTRILEQQRPLSESCATEFMPQLTPCFGEGRFECQQCWGSLRLAVYYMIKDKEAFADVSASDLLGPFFNPFSKTV